MDSGGIRRDGCAGSERNRRSAGGLIVASRGAGTVAALWGSRGTGAPESARSASRCSAAIAFLQSPAGMQMCVNVNTTDAWCLTGDQRGLGGFTGGGLHLLRSRRLPYSKCQCGERSDPGHTRDRVTQTHRVRPIRTSRTRSDSDSPRPSRADGGYENHANTTVDLEPISSSA